MIVEDTRQQAGKHEHRHEWWRAHGVEFEARSCALPFGDYMREGSNVCVDTKKDLAELSSDVLQQHDRFKRECERAMEEGYRLVILTETDRCTDLESLEKVRNVHPAARRVKPLPGKVPARVCRTMEEHHGVRFEFCTRADSARRVCELLGVDYDD